MAHHNVKAGSVDMGSILEQGLVGNMYIENKRIAFFLRRSRICVPLLVVKGIYSANLMTPRLKASNDNVILESSQGARVSIWFKTSAVVVCSIAIYLRRAECNIHDIRPS